MPPVSPINKYVVHHVPVMVLDADVNSTNYCRFRQPNYRGFKSGNPGANLWVTMEGKGCLKWKTFHLLNPKYELPCHNILQKTTCSTYRSTWINDILPNVCHISLTTTMWRFWTTCLGIHFWWDSKLLSAVLKCAKIGENHTAGLEKKKDFSMLDEAKIRDKVVCVTSDSTSNTLWALKGADFCNMPGFAHMMNIILQHTLNSSDDAVRTKIKSLVMAVCTSTKVTNE